MPPLRLFISSVQKEFAVERAALRNWLPNDALMPRYCTSSLTVEKLRRPHGSVPANPLLAESLYLTKYIERMGTGTADMIDRCRAAGLPEPEFMLSDGFVLILRRKPEKAFQAVGGEQPAGQALAAPPVTPPVTPPVAPPVEVLARLLGHAGELSNAEIRARLGLKDRRHLRERYVAAALEEGFIEPTLPDKPNSRLQKYRLTAKGRAWLDRAPDKASPPRP